MDRTRAARRGAGVTLIELCVTLSIAALLLSQAIPAMQQLRQRVLLRTAAEALGADLRLARDEALALNQPVHFRISHKGAAACYLLHVGPKDSCDCAGGRTVCLGGGARLIKATWLPAASPLQLISNVESMQFMQGRGTVTPTGSIEVRLNDRDAIRQVVAITGRVRSCSPMTAVADLPRCR